MTILLEKKMAFELMGLSAIGKYYKILGSFQSTILYIGIIYVPSKKIYKMFLLYGQH